MWFYPGGIAKILSLALTKNMFRVTYESHDGNFLKVSKQDGEVQIFVQSPTDLYFLDTAKVEPTVNGTFLVNTIADNKSRYTNTD